MRRILLTSVFALALLIGVSGGVAPVAHAITCPEGQVEGTEDLAGLCFPKAASSKSVGGTANYGTTPTAPKGNSDDAYNDIMSKIMSLFAWLVGVAAILLDNAVFYTVVRMGEYVNNLSAIGVAWRILRDVGNIMLIFGFLAIGITTILNVDWYGGGKKMLPMLFIGAIFLNFSLFITEAVIDTGNLFATQFYTQINGGNPAGEKSFDPGSLRVENEGISNKIMSQLGLATIYGQARNKTIVFEGANIFFIGFMGIFLFVITSFVLFTLAFILLARFIMLIFLIILAPVGFAGLAIPQLKGKAKQWWDKLFEQTITAPVLLLMLYVALAVITDEQFLIGGRGDWLGFVNGSNFPGFAGMLLSFLVAMGLLLFVVIASSKLSAFGAGWASQTAGKLTFGATAWGLNRTVGAGSRVLAQRMRTSSLNNTRAGRLLIKSAEYGAKSSFDVRGATIAGGLKGIGVDAGKAAEGGYQGARDRTTKKHEEYVKATDAAFDERNLRRGATEKDEKKAAEAASQLSAAERAHKEAEGKHTKAAEEHAQRLAEIKSIEEEKVTNATQADARKARLETAKLEAATSEVGLATAKKEVQSAKENLDKVSKDVKDKSGKMKDVGAYQAERVAEEKKNQKLAYAANISDFSSILLSGPGSIMAAKKIIKDAKKVKSDDEELLERLKKAVEKKDEKKEDKKPEGEGPKAEAAH